MNAGNPPMPKGRFSQAECRKVLFEVEAHDGRIVLAEAWLDREGLVRAQVHATVYCERSWLDAKRAIEEDTHRWTPDTPGRQSK